MAFTYRDVGRAFHEFIFSVFSVMAGWIAEMFFILFFTYITVQRTKHS